MSDLKKRIIGIDLGTTNSEVSIIVDGKPKLLQIEGSKIVPSVISIDKEGNVFVGQTALNNELVDPENTIRLIKRKMGKEEVLSIQGKDYTPSMVASLILSRLKKAAEDFYGEAVTQAIITVPAFFNEEQREATKLAGELAGLEVLRLLNEPTAAALAYSLGRKDKEISLVYDFGGGTFDVSIIDLSEGVMEVLASDGDVELGGSDFDLMIANKAKESFLAEYEIDLSANSLSWTRVLRAAEKAKIRLSTESEAEILEEFIEEKQGVPLHLKMRITRTEFEDMIHGSLQKTINSVRRALSQASCEASSLDRVVLVGGSTYIPLVSQMLKEELKIAPQAWLDPETVVAQGAAIEGASLGGESLGTIMLDITPHSLGTDCLDYFHNAQYEILIPRNTQLPCVASRLFFKVDFDQDAIESIIYQGESPRLKDNVELGKVTHEGLENSPHDEGICIKFEMDRSGILHVTSTDVATGKKVELVIEKESKSRMQTVNLADLKMLKIQVEDESVSLEEEQDILEEWTESLVTINEAVIERARAALAGNLLGSSEKAEIEAALALVHAEGSSEKLESLLYYLD